MNAEQILAQMRRFLLAFAGLILMGALVELSFTGHTKEAVQWIPFILCTGGAAAIALALARPERKTLLMLRASMGAVGLGSLLGMYEHVANNIALQVEIHPGLSLLERAAAGLGGANPLLAPGILGMAAALALAATYGHPGLAKGAAAKEAGRLRAEGSAREGTREEGARSAGEVNGRGSTEGVGRWIGARRPDVNVRATHAKPYGLGKARIGGMRYEPQEEGQAQNARGREWPA